VLRGVTGGLDLEVLRGIRGRQRPGTAVLRARIGEHLREHEGYVAFSGGKDSLVVLDLARQVDPGVPVVFFDSGLEFPETYVYLEELARRWRLNLDVIPAQPGLLEILIAGGRWDHHAPAVESPPVALHEALIARPAAIAHRRHGRGELWGVRAAESAGRRVAYAKALAGAECHCRPECVNAAARRAQHGGHIVRADGTIAFGPIWDWPHTTVWEHIAGCGLPINPVYAVLRAIGAPSDALRVSHMLDATRVEDGRVVWLRRGWPALFNELATLLPRLKEFV